MKPDILKKQSVSRSAPDQVQHQMKRGRLTALLLINSMSWRWKDLVTVKLRHSGGTVLICDRMPAYQLAQLCDLKQGRPTTGTPNEQQDDNGDEPTTYTTSNTGQLSVINAFVLPVGHITLNGDGELEISVETCAVPAYAPATTITTGYIKFVALAGPIRTDFILTHELMKDLETTESLVREIYLSGKNGVSFFDDGGLAANPIPKDIQIRLKANGELSESDLEVNSAVTAISGELSTAPGPLIRIFTDGGPLPSTVEIKVSGNDCQQAELLIIRETEVAHMTSQSIVNLLAAEQKKVEVLEATDPQKALALVQSGKIQPSEVISKAKDSIVVQPTPIAA